MNNAIEIEPLTLLFQPFIYQFCSLQELRLTKNKIEIPLILMLRTTTFILFLYLCIGSFGTTCIIIGTDTADATLCPSLANGDTMLIQGTLHINATYDVQQTKDIVIIVDNDSIIWNGNFRFIVGAGSTFKLINGAKVVNGLGSCNGTKLITFGSTDLASCNGGGAAHSFDEVNAAGGINSIGTLPVSLLEINHQVQSNHTTTLNWSTASEQNNLHFILERSVDGVHFEPIATIPGSGNSNAKLDYTYTDHFPIGEGLYYQLKQEDYNGTTEHLGIIQVHLNTGEKLLAIMPTPATNKLILKGEILVLSESTTILITNSLGTIMLQQDLIADKSVQINIEDLPAGAYTLHINHNAYRFVKW